MTAIAAAFTTAKHNLRLRAAYEAVIEAGGCVYGFDALVELNECGMGDLHFCFAHTTGWRDNRFTIAELVAKGREYVESRFGDEDIDECYIPFGDYDEVRERLRSL